MKKQAEFKDWVDLIKWVTICLVVIFLFMFGMYYSIKGLVKQDYKIYKNECYNKTENIYYEFPKDFTRVNCPNKKIEVPCYDSKGSEIHNLKCSRDAYDYSNKNCYKLKGYENNPSKLIEDYNYPPILKYYWIQSDSPEDIDFSTLLFHNPYLPIKNQSIKEVCERKEVNEMDYGIWYRNDNNKPIHIIITKKDITKEWLDNNCKCKECPPNNNKNCLDTCSKYKCGEYEVEVR